MKTDFWLVETIFLHFLRQQSTATSGSSFFFNWNIFFSQSFISLVWTSFFLLEIVFFYSKFFFANGSCYWNRFSAIVEEYVSTIQKNCFFWQKYRKWFPLTENIFLLKLIPSNFNHGFQQQKRGSEQKHAVSTRQKIRFH